MVNKNNEGYNQGNRMIHLHNTLGNKLEEFKPIKSGHVGMYHCGPTVYDYIHIGNLRAFFTADIVRRVFEHFGYEVKQVMNVTDVGIGGDNDEGEDKIIKGLRREGKEISLDSMKELTDFYTERFKEDIMGLNIKTPHIIPRASEHIAEDIQLIEKLEKKGFVYKTSDGIYFDTSKTPDYGTLGGIVLEDKNESRIIENQEKRNKRDFALWKFNTSLGFQSPWGQGFPGWHIECSAMSTKYLGETFDIHTGGIDLASIHHNNEIVQSENACDCKYAHYWLHNGFLNISDDKMAKSEGNFITLRTLVERGFSPLAYRYFLLLAHYRTPANFTWEALEAAENAYRRLKEFVSNTEKLENTKVSSAYAEAFKGSIGNDLNTPEALAVVWKLVKDDSLSPANKRATLLDFDQVLGLKLDENEFEVKDIPEEIQGLLNERESARINKNFQKSDELRDQIKNLGFEVKDTENGPRLSKYQG